MNAAPEGDWVLEVLGVPYGGPYGGRDAQGEYFTAESDLWLERIPRRPVVYYHGLDEIEALPEIIGEELGWERRVDGVWFRVRLDRSQKLAARVWEAAKEGLARASSGALAHLVRRTADGRILQWPMGELSLLDAREHQPANPYAVAIMAAKALFAAAGLDGSILGEPSDQQQGDTSLPKEKKILHCSRNVEKEQAMTINEMDIRGIIREEMARVWERSEDAAEGAGLYLTHQASATIRERGEKALTANGTPLVDAIKALRRGQFDVVRFQIAGKALAEGTDPAGGYLVPVEGGAKIIALLGKRTAVRAAGATVVPMASDTLNIPAQSGGSTAYWVAENAQITASDQTWSQVQLTAKKLAAMTKLSSELFEDSDPAVETLVMADLARSLAEEEDIKYLTGTGAGNTPVGLEAIANVNIDTATLGADGGAPDFDDLANMVYALDADNVPADGRAWIMHPRTLNGLRKLKALSSGSNEYVWADPSAPGDPPLLWGYPVFTSTGLSITQTRGNNSDCSTIYLGCWPEFIIGQRKQLELRASDAAGGAFEYDQVFIRAIMRVDCGLRHAASFEVLKGARA